MARQGKRLTFYGWGFFLVSVRRGWNAGGLALLPSVQSLTLTMLRDIKHKTVKTPFMEVTMQVQFQFNGYTFEVDPQAAIQPNTVVETFDGLNTAYVDIEWDDDVYPPRVVSASKARKAVGRKVVLASRVV